MTDEESPDTESRQRRLATHKRRTRVVGAVVTVAVIAVAIGGVMALRDNDQTSAAPTDKPAAAKREVPAPDSSVGIVRRVGPPRLISHDNPLRLWIGGDSLAGSFGPALGQIGGATGVVDASIDYKVSSGLEDQGIRDWDQHATQEMADEDPDHVVFIIGANDVSIVNSHDGNGDGVEDWSVDYREKVHRMMEILVGGARHRIVYWLGPPTMGDDNLNDGARALGQLMRSEAKKFAPDIVYIDTYKIFADENGDYSRSLPDAHGEEQEMRISDGVHFSVEGAKYLADILWTRILKRWSVAAQADPTNPIDYSIAEGSNDYVPGVGRYRPTVPDQSEDTTPSSWDTTSTIGSPTTTTPTNPVSTTTKPVVTTTIKPTPTTVKPPPVTTP